MEPVPMGIPIQAAAPVTPAAVQTAGLAALLQSLNLHDKLGAADAWCADKGAEHVADIAEYGLAEELVSHLQLPIIKVKKLLAGLQSAAAPTVTDAANHANSHTPTALPPVNRKPSVGGSNNTGGQSGNTGTAYDVFISYYSAQSDATFTSLMGTLKALDYVVFNQKRDLAGHDVNLAEMQRHVKSSRLVLALLSPGYFTSPWCRGELDAAASAGVPIVPVFSGEDYTRKSILALNDKSDPGAESYASVKAAFAENLIDISNGDHADQVICDLKQKIIARFLT